MTKQLEAHAAAARAHRRVADLHQQLSKPARSTTDIAKRPEIRFHLQQAQADLRTAEALLGKAW